jgi:hypothetical protein
MNPRVLAVLLASLVLLAGCSGGSSDGGATTTAPSAGGESGGDGGNSGGNGGDGTTAGGSGGETGEPELLQFQFDRVERSEYETEAYGNAGNLVLEVESVTDGTAAVRIDYDLGGRETTRTYEVPAGDREAFVQAAQRETYAGAVLVLQSNDAPITFVENDVEWAVGNTYESPISDGNVTVTGRDTVAGVECVTYESYIDGTLLQDGCLSTDHEVAIAMTQYNPDGTARTRLTLTGYEQG